jgi:FkbM family methyltransferase
MIEILKRLKTFATKMFYLYFPFVSKTNKKKSFYKFVQDGYNNLLYQNLKINNNSIVFDIGGYKGEFTERILSICQCKIYIFEPVNEFYNIINKKYENIPLVSSYNLGLGGEKKIIKINVRGSSSSTFNLDSNNVHTEEIIIESINEFIKENKIDFIHIMKINIEGGEYSLIESLINTNYIQNINIILVQFHDFVPNAKIMRKNIQRDLLATHNKIYDYPFIWEKWVLKEKTFGKSL